RSRSSKISCHFFANFLTWCISLWQSAHNRRPLVTTPLPPCDLNLTWCISVPRPPHSWHKPLSRLYISCLTFCEKLFRCLRVGLLRLFTGFGTGLSILIPLHVVYSHFT